MMDEKERTEWNGAVAWARASDIEALRAECLGDKPSPTWEEIIALIPPEKRIIVGGEP
jgi:hypothetical protein